MKKAVSLNFGGEGKRSVKVGYVTESPIWKTSYRLALKKGETPIKTEGKREQAAAKDEVMLQGWAVVENTTDEDWNSVQLGLVSGRPISFQMDLYQPLFVNRPTVELELFASLRPPVYDGNMADEKAALPMDAPSGGFGMLGGMGGMPAAPAPMAARGMNGVMADAQMQRKAAMSKRDQFLRNMDRDKDAVEFQKDVATAAVSTELGEFFQYVIKQPVSLPRQKSALLPIINDEVKGSKVSIFNEQVHSKFPLLGLKFTNSTSLHLCQGPITVFEDSTYAGDARISDLQPKETRLLSYAIDLGTEVDAQHRESEDLLKVKLVKGLIHQEFLRKEFKTYKIKNRSEHARTLLVEHPYRHDFKLVAPAKAAEQSRNVYRFEVACEPNKPTELVVEEQLPRFTQIAFSNSGDESVRFLIRSKATSDKVKQGLERALELRHKVTEAQQELAREERLLKTIEQDQARMRANMAQVPPTSAAFKRYEKKFDEQETEIEKRRETITKLQDRAEQQRNSFDAFVANLSVD
jgi:hypothetical protein